MIDTGILDPSEPIDLCSLCQTNQYKIDAYDNHFGVHLTDEGIDLFKAKVNIEVQHASEHVIAAVERNGGVIRTAFYDIFSVLALSDPETFFKKGEPIPRRSLPPPDMVEYYTDAKNRGYLANPEDIAKERFLLAQKYGYTLNDIKNDPKSHILLAQKDPRQVFYGLQPGWLVNLRDKTVYKPSAEALLKYYSS
jgi:large subunit ribosomal protein L15